jgi:hypothetical protein
MVNVTILRLYSGARQHFVHGFDGFAIRDSTRGGLLRGEISLSRDGAYARD